MPFVTGLIRIALGVAAVGLAVSPALADVVELNSGEKLEGEILSDTESEVVMEHPVLGRITIPRAEVKAEEAVNPGLFGTNFLLGWNRNLGAGLSGSAGVSSDLDVNLTMGLNREGERHRQEFTARYFYSQARDDTTGETTTGKNQFFGRYIHDFLFPGSRFFLFGSGRYDYDQFEDWSQRIQASGGVGYELIQTESVQLRTRVGAGVSQTFSPSNTSPEGLVNLDLGWDVVEGQRLTARATFFPNFGDMPEWRFFTEAAYNISLGIIEGLGLRIGYQYEYDRGALGEKNDLKYLANLIYNF